MNSLLKSKSKSKRTYQPEIQPIEQKTKELPGGAERARMGSGALLPIRGSRESTV